MANVQLVVKENKMVGLCISSENETLFHNLAMVEVEQIDGDKIEVDDANKEQTTVYATMCILSDINSGISAQFAYTAGLLTLDVFVERVRDAMGVEISKEEVLSVIDYLIENGNLFAEMVKLQKPFYEVAANYSEKYPHMAFVDRNIATLEEAESLFEFNDDDNDDDYEDDDYEDDDYDDYEDDEDNDCSTCGTIDCPSHPLFKR